MLCPYGFDLRMGFVVSPHHKTNPKKQRRPAEADSVLGNWKSEVFFSLGVQFGRGVSSASTTGRFPRLSRRR
jgi:hypothetical protein